MISLGALLGASVVLGCASSGPAPDPKPASVEGLSQVTQSLASIPQQGMSVGSPSAPVEMVEYVDPYCPVCAQYSQDAGARALRELVRHGKLRVEVRFFAYLSPDSPAVAAAALAAGEQDRGFAYLELFYRNQPSESERLPRGLLQQLASALRLDMARFERDRRRLKAEAQRQLDQAERMGLKGTPSLIVSGPGGQRALLGAPDYRDLLRVISQVSKKKRHTQP